MIAELINRVLLFRYAVEEATDLEKYLKIPKRGDRLRLREEIENYRLELEANLRATEASRAETEHQLGQIAEAMDTMDYAEAMADSMQGGPGFE